MLSGKTVVITGVASGIGKNAAQLAHHSGATVIGVDVREPHDFSGTFIPGDLSSKSGVDAIVDQLPSSIDALCNVAGLSGSVGAVPTLSVNFYGLRELTLTALNKISDGGSVINVASIAGFQWRANIERASALMKASGFPDVGAVLAANEVNDQNSYPVSKEVLLLWTMRSAHEAVFKDRHIRVNAVSPGPVTTPILDQFREVLGDERVDSDIDRVGRAGTAGDIGPLIVFLCSDGACWINGANIPVDGGLEASINAEVLNF